MVSETTKACTKCGKVKPATPEFFYRESRKKFGLKSWCRDCTQEYREANREKIRQKAREYRQDNPEKIRQADKKYRQDNPDTFSRANKKYRQANLEKIRQKHKEYRKANPEKIKESKKKWAQANPEKDKEGRRKNERKRRALKLENGHSPYTETEVLNLYGTDCHLCSQPIDFEAPRRFNKPGWELGLHIDHIIPISKGGSDTLENVKPAHGRCNVSKGNRLASGK